jgi:hypothetical protein
MIAAALVNASMLGHSAAAGEAPAMRVYVDPATGAVVPESRVAPAPLLLDPATSKSAVGLVEEPAPGGGVLVDLKGRFQTPLVAEMGSDGTVQVHHAGKPPSR